MKVGSRVKFIDEVGEGVIVQYTPDQSLVEHADGFERWWKNEELLCLDELEELEVEYSDLVADELKRINSARASEKSGKLEFIEVDLHIEAIPGSSDSWSSFEKLQYQLTTADDALNKARSLGIKKVILIHGVGTGRLRYELEVYLNGEGEEWYDASYREYGQGAIEVNVRQNR